MKSNPIEPSTERESVSDSDSRQQNEGKRLRKETKERDKEIKQGRKEGRKEERKKASGISNAHTYSPHFSFCVL